MVEAVPIKADDKKGRIRIYSRPARPELNRRCVQMDDFHVQIRHEISSLANYLKRITTEEQQVFDGQFHARLKQINELSLTRPEERDDLIFHCARACSYELDRCSISHHCRNKPLGYQGDYLVSDWIYKEKKIPLRPLDGLWEEFGHRLPVVQAIKNRKEYFCNLLCGLTGKSPGGIAVLNLGCGSCRDVAEAIVRAGSVAAGSLFHCVDKEDNALAYAQNIIRETKADHVTFQWEVSPILRLQTQRHYGLVWAGGILDLLGDFYATKVLSAAWNWTAPGGMAIVSNLHPNDPTRNALEWCWKWFLNYRSIDNLRKLCDAAKIPQSSVRFEQEPLGICTLCIMTKPA